VTVELLLDEIGESEKAILDPAAWKAALVPPELVEDWQPIADLFLAHEELVRSRAEFEDAMGAMRDAEIEQRQRMQS
jgi:hypothetical protein